MTRFYTILLSLFLTLTVQAQDEQKDSIEASLPTDVYAYYVVVTPGSTIASIFGHAAIRMSCPSAGLDYCFTIKTPEIKDGFFDIFFGHLRMGLVPEETVMFRDDYTKEGRGITEYQLDLTLDEARQLWKTLDDQVARGLYWNMDYVNNGCTQVTFDALYDLMRMRDGLNVDEKIREALPIRTRRDAVLKYLDPSTWMGFILHSCYAGPIDEEVSPRRLVVVPADGAKVLDEAGIILAKEELSRSSVTPLSEQHTWFTPLMASVLLLLLCLIPSRKVDYVTIPLQFVLLLLLGSLAFFSQSSGFGWNWLIIALFPLTAPIGIIYMLFHMGGIFCLPQLVVVVAFLIRTIYFINRKKRLFIVFN